MTPSPGDPVRVEMTKWGGRPHWEMDAVHLGADEHGDWIGFPIGTHMSRPGADFTTTNLQVGLVTDQPWLATFHGPGYLCWKYVDMTTVPVWDGTVVRAVDLDLDVIELTDHTVYVDDEDELAEHSELFAYPAEIVALARTSCSSVLQLVHSATAPFDGPTAQRWLDVLAAVER